MNPIRRTLLVALLLFAPAAAGGDQAARSDLSGTYAVLGRNPDAGAQYHGTVVVQQTGTVYQIVWRIGDRQHYAGTGILRDDTLAVVYQAPGTPPGIAAYQVAADGSLSGTWTGLGAAALGTETWMPRDRF